MSLCFAMIFFIFAEMRSAVPYRTKWVMKVVYHKDRNPNRKAVKSLFYVSYWNFDAAWLSRFKRSSLSFTALRMLPPSSSMTLVCVDFGLSVRPRVHRVGKNAQCTCSLGRHCPAVAVVRNYLADGGQRAPTPPPGYYPVAPAACPVCGAEVLVDQRLSNKRRGVGWRCKAAGSLHYWQQHVQVLRELVTAQPWIFPPVYDQAGNLLYPGLRREDLISPNQKLNWPEGFNPQVYAPEVFYFSISLAWGSEISVIHCASQIF
jgi:hypothetical protein